MRTSRKLLLGIAVLSLISLVFFAGCNRTPETSAAPSESLTYWTMLGGRVADHYTNFGQTPLAQEIAKRTGIEVEYVHASPANWEAEFNMMLASRDLTDMIEYWFPYYPGGPEKAVLDGTIIRLNDIIDRWAPNYKRVLDNNPDWKKQASTDSGLLFSFPHIRGGDDLLFYTGLMVRMDWLRELNLELPTTMSEVHDVLVAFKERKGVPAPFTGTNRQLLDFNAFNMAFSLLPGWYLDNGTVHFGAVEPRFRDYLVMMNQWYREGLIDPDIFSNDANVRQQKMLNGDSGMTYANLGGGVNTWNTAAKQTNPSFSLEMAPHPSLQRGVPTEFSQMENYVFNGNYHSGITGTTNKQELAARWLDFRYTDEGHMLFNFGIEGVSYTMVNGYPTYTQAMLNPPGSTPNDALAGYIQANYGGTFIQDPRYFLQVQATTQEARDSLPRIINPAMQRHLFPNLSPTPAESAEFGRIMTDINTYIDEMVTKYILGTENINTFDTFVATIRRMGFDRALEIQNAGLQRYNAR